MTAENIFINTCCAFETLLFGGSECDENLGKEKEVKQETVFGHGLY